MSIRFIRVQNLIRESTSIILLHKRVTSRKILIRFISHCNQFNVILRLFCRTSQSSNSLTVFKLISANYAVMTPCMRIIFQVLRSYNICLFAKQVSMNQRVAYILPIYTSRGISQQCGIKIIIGLLLVDMIAYGISTTILCVGNGRCKVRIQ